MGLGLPGAPGAGAGSVARGAYGTSLAHLKAPFPEDRHQGNESGGAGTWKAASRLCHPRKARGPEAVSAWE